MAGFSVVKRGIDAKRDGRGPTAVSSTTALNPVTGIIPVVNAADPAYGAKADAQQSTGTINSGQNTLTITAGNIPSVGQFVMVPGAGVVSGGAGGPFTAYVSSVASNVVTLVTAKGGSTGAPATTTVAGATVTFGTGISPALITAFATGKRVHLPAGSYVWDAPVGPSSLYFTGDGIGRTIIYFSSSITVLQVTGPGLVGSTGALTVNAVAGAQSLTIGGGVPAGINPGDYIYLSSSTVFDAAESFCTLGEFCRVYGISGTTVYLNSPLTGPFTYTTAATAKIQKMTFLEGVHVSDMEWINGTPEKFTAGTATPATPINNAGLGNVIRIRRASWPTFENMKVTGWTGDFLGITNCLHFRTENIDGRDGAQNPTASAGNSYGYMVSANGSMWGEVLGGSIEMCHGYFNAEGTGQIAGDIVMPSSQVEVRNATSRNGIGEPFLCHNAAAFIDFIDCKVIGGPLFPTENTHNSGFQLVGKYCRTINPVISNASGRPLFLGNDHCEAIRPVIRNLAPWNDRCDAINVAGTNCRVVSADIDGVPNDLTVSSGRGIFVQVGATGFQMSGRSTIRNTASDAVFIADTSNTESIDGLLGISNGRYVIETAGTSPQGLWANVRGVSFSLGLTNAASGLVPVAGNYQAVTVNGTFTVPVGVTKLRVRAIGGGGGGGGGGSATTGIAQAGGGGGAGGSIADQEFTAAAGDVITVTIGAAGTSGTLGAAAGNPGGAGGNGGTTIVVNTTAGGVTLMQAKGGTGGLGGAASSTTNVAGGIYGANATGGTSGQFVGAGSGAPSASATTYPNICVVGGSGGGAATATLGGGGGNAQLSSAFVNQQAGGSSGASGTTSGLTGVTATQPGCGGGGGGGGTNNTGAGGAGGAGATGLVELWW